MLNLSLTAKKNLNIFFFADLISQFGSGMSFIGLNWFLLAKTGSNAQVGILMSISIAAGLFALPLVGIITDKFNRKILLILSNYLRAFFIGIIVLALLFLPFNVNYLYILAVINGLGWNIYLTSSRALLQEISSENLLKGNSLIEISLQVGMFTAGAAAGIIYKYFGIQTILIIDILTFIVSNILLSLIQHQNAISSSNNETFIQQLLDGYEYFKHHFEIFLFGIIVFLPYVATVGLNVVLPGYISHALKGGSVLFGLADMSYGIGASLSGVVIMLLSLKYPRKYMAAPFFILSIFSIIVLFFNHFFALAFASLLFLGLSNSSIRIMLNAIVMETVPKAYMGRAMATWNFISIFLQLLTVSSIGFVMDTISVRFGYSCLFLIMLIALGGYLLLKKKAI